MLNLLAACVFASQSVMNCASTAPMPTHAPTQIMVITGYGPTALATQNASDQTQRDNAAIASAQAQAQWESDQYQRYLANLARDHNAVTRWLVNGR